MVEAPSCLLLTGAVGSGKSATAEAVGRKLREIQVPHAVIDLDALRRSWPAPSDDPFNSALEAKNLRALVTNYRRAGAVKLVIAGVVEGANAVSRYSDAVAEPLVVVRLKVKLSRIHSRLLSRHEPGGDRDWHLDRSGRLDEILDRENAADATIEVVDESIDSVAQRVLELILW